MNGIFTIPNIFTASRIPIVYLGLHMIGAGSLVWGLAVVLVGFVTDLFDGFIARRSKSVTKFGATIDPIADIVSLALVYSHFYYNEASPEWVKTAILVILFRNFFLSLGYKALQWLYEEKTGVTVSWFGKFSSATQMVAAFIGLMGPGYASLFAIVFGTGAILSVSSGIDYATKAIKLISRRHRQVI